MLLRALLSILLTAGLMSLVVWQIRITETAFKTVEMMSYARDSGLTLDRHYAMPLDFCVIAPFVGLCVFLCAPQWTLSSAFLYALVSALIIAACLWLWKDGHEAHAIDGTITGAGWVHALFAGIAVWVFLLVLFGTPSANPALLLVMAIVIPAFLFVGQHMFLGMIDHDSDAITYDGEALRDPKGWAILMFATAVVWWRAGVLIPSSFWTSLQ